jgi:hypothetical protein
MSMLRGAIRQRPSLTDEAVERRLAALFSHLEPDPLFRRRMRSEALNRFVAAREGISVPLPDRAARSTMGSLGRACLYASLTLSVSAASVLAASQGALPGETLYGLKLQIEQVRMEVLPGHLHEQLVANALTERIDEMARLADADNLDQALAMAPQVEAGLEQLLAVQESTEAVAATDGIEQQLLVLDALIEQLPERARSAIDTAIEGVPGLHLGQGGSVPPGRNGRGPQADPKATGGAGSAPFANGLNAVDAEATPELSSSRQNELRPEPTATPTQRADESPAANGDARPRPQGGPAR